MRFIAENNPSLYIDVDTFDELNKRIKESGDSNYNYEVILESSFKNPLIVGKIRATPKCENKK